MPERIRRKTKPVLREAVVGASCRVSVRLLREEDRHNQGFEQLTEALGIMVRGGTPLEEASVIFADFAFAFITRLGGEPGARAIVQRFNNKIAEMKAGKWMPHEMH